MSSAKFSEDIIITKIKKNGTPFDLSTEELMDLKKEGVSDNIIKYLLDPSLPYTPAPPPATGPTTASPGVTTLSPVPPVKKYPPDPFALRVPPEPGMYFFRENTPTKITLKFLLGSEQAKSLMKKGKTLAYLIGPSAEARLRSPNPTFYVRLPDGKEIEETVLVNMTEKNGRRLLELGPKQEIRAEDTRERNFLEVGPRLFRVRPAKLDSGEYLLYFIGSVEPPKGVFGKGYDFGIEEPAKKD